MEQVICNPVHSESCYTDQGTPKWPLMCGYTLLPAVRIINSYPCASARLITVGRHQLSATATSPC